CCAALLTAAAVLVPARAARADDEADAARQQEAVKAETEQMVRRVGTMLRVLEYYRLDKTAEKKVLNEVASTLSGLSRKQMAEVTARLEAAAAAKPEEAAGREMDAARERHKEILRSLKGLLSRYDAMKSLDQAAERLEKAATQQFDLSRQSARTLQDL